MKRKGNLFYKIVDLDNLSLAAHKAFLGKSDLTEVVKFRGDFLGNLYLIRDELTSGDFKFGDYHKFIIYEPKKREICAAPLKQRIVHHAIMNICHDIFDKHLIFDSYASRPGKGSHKAIMRLKGRMVSYKYYAKLDIRKFFDSIDHYILKTLLYRLFKDERLLIVFDKIIDSYGQGKGLPIGNLTSQYFANHYLSTLDHYMKEVIKVPFYIRYMDDVVILSNDRIELKRLVSEYVKYANEQLRLDVKPSLIGRNCSSIPFLGYKVFRDRIMMNGKGKRRFKKNIVNLGNLYNKSLITEKEYSDRITAVLAYAKFADSHKFRDRFRMNVIEL